MDQFEFEENKKKRKLKKKPIYIFVCIVCLIVGGCLGFYLGSPRQSTHSTITLYDQIVDIIGKQFLDTTDSEISLDERMLNGMVSGLGDPYSSYLTSEEANDLSSTIDGSFDGIGVSYIAIPAGALVMEVFEGSPAYKTGMKAGDIITHVQGTSVAGYDSNKIKSEIVGEKGTSVSVQILRNGKDMIFHMQRSNVESSLGYEVRIENNQKIGYLRITTFGSTTTALAEKALKEFEKQNVSTICIDLRGNSGGYLVAAQGLLDFFVPEGEMMFKVQYKSEKDTEYKASDVKKYSFQNGYILVDGGSASAAEVMTSGLKESLGYKVIGSTTFGKGIVQSQLTLPNSSTLKLTTARWLTPKGNWIHKKGIKPDYEVNDIRIDDYKIFGELKERYQYDNVNENVAEVQKVLKALGYSIDRTDGYFSLKTQSALKLFEKNFGLKEDGVLDQKDLNVLISAYAYYVYQKAPDKTYNQFINLIK